MTNGEIILPKICSKTGKPKISYSQISSFLKNKRDYIRQYFFNEPFVDNAYLEFGRKVGSALETGDFTSFTEKEQEFLKTIPRYEEFEREINLDMGEFVLIGYIDSNTKDLKKIIDYKSGTESKIGEYTKEEYIQLLIYALAIEQETGKLPESLKVILYDRKGNAFKGETLELGERFWEIDLEISEERINFAKELIIKTVNSISDYYKVFLKLNK